MSIHLASRTLKSLSRRGMDETAHEMTRIGAMQPSAAIASQPAVVAGELERVVSMQWSGPLDGAVKRLGETIGYSTAITGTVPHAGVGCGANVGGRAN
jgi:defect-in-organelle-trafficking protein DotD